jgi:stearoyl-CoA desaturase (delta-9 desaturase)
LGDLTGTPKLDKIDMSRGFNISLPGSLFIMLHLACFAVFWTGINLEAVALCAFMFFIRKFGITGGFHRYFSHRSYKTSRFFQFCLAFLGGAAAQKGALWWAAQHRHHHKHSDTGQDIHSAKLEGFYWSHVGWVLCKEYEDYDPNVVRDLIKFPELVWLDKYIFIPPVVAAAFCLLVGHFWFGNAMMGLVVGFFFSTVILYHTTFAINSLCHMFGTRRYDTGEESKNSLWLAIVTMGEGWHNNHHHYPLSARQGFFWWEIDITYYILLGLEKLGIVWNLQVPPKRVLQPEAMIGIEQTRVKKPECVIAEVT